MKKINCNIIRDILPLYLDDVVCDETKLMVEEHLQSCASCREEAASMKGYNRVCANLPAAYANFRIACL